MRCLVGDLGFGAVGVAVGDGTRGAGAWVLFVEGIRVDKGAVAGLWLGAIVEDPDNLGDVSRWSRSACEVLTVMMASRM